MRKHTGKPLSAVSQEILSRFLSGENMQQISLSLRVSYYHVKKCILDAGLQLRSRAEINKMRRPCVDPEALRKILDSCSLSHHEIASHFGVSVSTLTRTMRSLGYNSVKGRGSKGAKNYFWKGGRSLDSDGYVLLKCPDHPQANRNGYVREHRLVMEKILGRYLDSEEVVHHIDGDKANNSPENLELHVSNGAHLRGHMLEGSIPRCQKTGRLVKKQVLQDSRQQKALHQ